MKLSMVVVRDAIPQVSGKAFNAEHWDLSYEAGLVTMVARDALRGDATYLIPVSNVVGMRPAPQAAAAKK